MATTDTVTILGGLPYQSSLGLHIAAGTIALATFWTSALARKGGRVHRASGKVFLLAMCIVLVTGVPLVVQRFLLGRPVEGVFLGYLFFITGNACWMMWHAVRDKADWQHSIARPMWRIWTLSCLLVGLGVLLLGLRAGDPVVIGVALIGPFIALRMRRFARRGPTRSNWHVVMHFQNVLGAGIATHVAFLGVGMSHVWPLVARAWPTLPQPLVYMFPWFAPLTVAAVIGMVLTRKYAQLGKPYLAKH